MRGQRKPKKQKAKHQEQTHEKQEIFVCGAWRNHRKLFTQLKKIDETTHYVVTVFYGFGRKKPLENCETIRRMLQRKGIVMTYDMVHAYKWAGLLLLGWQGPIDEKYKNKAEALLEEFETKTKEGDKKMSNFDTIITALRSKVLDKGFSKFAGDLDIFLESEEGQPKYYFHPVLRQIVERGKNTPTEVCKELIPLDITVGQVVETAEILFCFANPSEGETQMPEESARKYKLLKGAYEKAQEPSSEEAPLKDVDKPRYYRLVPMEETMENGVLLLKDIPIENSEKDFIVQLRNKATVEEFKVVPCLSLPVDQSDEDFQHIKSRLKEETELILYEPSEEGSFDIAFCFFDKIG